MGKCQHDAGILKDGKLSPAAKSKFIQDLKDLLVMGSKDAPTPPLPCGPEIPPFKFAEMAPIEQEELYPDLYKNVLGQYENIAKSLDAEGQFPLFPIADPVALAVALDAEVPKLNFPGDMLTYGMALPMLAVILGITIPIDLLNVVLDKKLNIPKLPPGPEIPLIDFDPLQLPELLKFNGLLYGIPPKLIEVALKLIADMPKLIVPMLKLDLSGFCEPVMKAEPFGPFDLNNNPTWAASQIILTRKTAECVTINAVGSTVGSSSGGVVGWLGGKNVFGYVPPPGPDSKSNAIRNMITNAAEESNGLTWKDDDNAIKNGTPDKAKYQWFLLPFECYDAIGIDWKVKYMHDALKGKSSCGLFARACLRSGGAQGANYTGKYDFNAGNVFQFIHDDATRYDANRPWSTNSVPPIKAGDIIHVGPVGNPYPGHMIVATSDHPGGILDTSGKKIKAVAGGQGGPDTVTGFMLAKSDISFIGPSQNRLCVRYAGQDGASADREVIKIIDAEKLVLGTQAEPK